MKKNNWLKIIGKFVIGIVTPIIVGVVLYHYEDIFNGKDGNGYDNTGSPNLVSTLASDTKNRTLNIEDAKTKAAAVWCRVKDDNVNPKATYYSRIYDISDYKRNNYITDRDQKRIKLLFVNDLKNRYNKDFALGDILCGGTVETYEGTFTKEQNQLIKGDAIYNAKVNIEEEKKSGRKTIYDEGDLSLTAADSDDSNEIRTIQQFVRLSKFKQITKPYKLMIDINWHDGLGEWSSPVLVSSFDGNGKTIYGITKPLFQQVSRGGEISNVNVEASVSCDELMEFASSDNIDATLCSGLVLENLGTISGSSLVGTITCQEKHKKFLACAGLVALNQGSINDSTVSGRIVSDEYVIGYYGGLVAVNAAGASIYDSSSSMHLSNCRESTCGGLAGTNGGKISNSKSSGAITCKESSCGGLIGSIGNSGFIEFSSSSSKILCVGSTCGGVAAANFGELERTAYFGTIECKYLSMCGGVVGKNQGNIEDVIRSDEFKATLTCNYSWCGGIVETNTGDMSEIRVDIKVTCSNESKCSDRILDNQGTREKVFNKVENIRCDIYSQCEKVSRPDIYSPVPQQSGIGFSCQTNFGIVCPYPRGQSLGSHCTCQGLDNWGRPLYPPHPGRIIP